MNSKYLFTISTCCNPGPNPRPMVQTVDPDAKAAPKPVESKELAKPKASKPRPWDAPVTDSPHFWGISWQLIGVGAPHFWSEYVWIGWRPQHVFFGVMTEKRGCETGDACTLEDLIHKNRNLNKSTCNIFYCNMIVNIWTEPRNWDAGMDKPGMLSWGILRSEANSCLW